MPDGPYSGVWGNKLKKVSESENFFSRRRNPYENVSRWGGSCCSRSYRSCSVVVTFFDASGRRHSFDAASGLNITVLKRTHPVHLVARAVRRQAPQCIARALQPLQRRVLRIVQPVLLQCMPFTGIWSSCIYCRRNKQQRRGRRCGLTD